eukprot:gene53218-8172_t
MMVDNLSYHICLSALAIFFGYSIKAILIRTDPAVLLQRTGNVEK